MTIWTLKQQKCESELLSHENMSSKEENNLSQMTTYIHMIYDWIKKCINTVVPLAFNLLEIRDVLSKIRVIQNICTLGTTSAVYLLINFRQHNLLKNSMVVSTAPDKCSYWTTKKGKYRNLSQIELDVLKLIIDVLKLIEILSQNMTEEHYFTLIRTRHTWKNLSFILSILSNMRRRYIEKK